MFQLHFIQFQGFISFGVFTKSHYITDTFKKLQKYWCLNCNKTLIIKLQLNFYAKSSPYIRSYTLKIPFVTFIPQHKLLRNFGYRIADMKVN